MIAGEFSHPTIGENGHILILSEKEAAFLRYHLMNSLDWAMCNQKNPGSGEALGFIWTGLCSDRQHHLSRIDTSALEEYGKVVEAHITPFSRARNESK
jgi:hypothetical protein